MIRPFQFKCWHILLPIIILMGCKQGKVNPDDSIIAAPTLIFNSGFEPGTEGLPTDAHQIIQGKDLSYSTKNDWLIDLDDHSKIGAFSIQYQGGSASERYARIVDDSTSPGNKVLTFWLDRPNVLENNVPKKGRIQANIYENNGIVEMSHSQRVYLHPDFNYLKGVTPKIGWLTVHEYWNNPGWLGDPFPFRITININKVEEGPVSSLYFQIHGQTNLNGKWVNLWEEVNTNVPVPIGEWFTSEIYFKEGDANTGRFTMTITTANGAEQIVHDITNFTHHPDDPDPDGLSHFNPLKLYTSAPLIDTLKSVGKTLQISWDDFSIQINE